MYAICEQLLPKAVNFEMRKNCPYSELFWSAFSRIWITPNADTFYAELRVFWAKCLKD